MVYAYDVLINFNDVLYDFYDWKDTDDFYHVRRCPLFKVSTNILGDFTYKRVRISNEFLTIIKDKTQVFTSKNIITLEYSFIVSDGVNSLILLLDNKGIVVKKSKFLINEEIEISNMCKTIKSTVINYNVINNTIKRNNMLRDSSILINKILLELELIKLDLDKINYLYYEWFNKESTLNPYLELVKDIKKGYTDKHKEFYNLLSMLTVKK